MPLIPERVRRWPRPWRVALFSLLALYALYLLAGNVFLNTPLFDAVTNRKPEKFTLETGPSLTLMPGHAFVWNIRIRGQANHTVYIFRADRASAWISLVHLFKREVRIPSIDATGVESEIERVEKAIPPPPRGDRGWNIRLDAIHSDSIRSGRFGKLLIVGQGHGTVGFQKQTKGGPSELFDSTAGFEQATISYDGMTLLDEAHIASRFHYPRHYRDEAPGLRKLGITFAELQMDGRSQAINIDTSGPHVKVGSMPAEARLNATLTMDRGLLQPGSRLVWRVPVHAGVHAPDRGLLSLQLDVAQDIRIQARLPRDPDTGSELDADLRVSGRRIPFEAPAELLPRLSGQVKGAWRFDSLNWIADLFVRKPWFRLDGGGLLQGDLKIVDGALAPGSRVDVPKVVAVSEVAGVRMQGEASAVGRIVEDAPPQAELQVAIPQFRAAPVDAPKTVLFDGKAMALTLRGDARLQQLRDGMRARLRFRDARVPDLTAYNRYVGGNNVRLLGGTGLLSGDVELDTSGRVGQGRADLRGRGARMQVAGMALSGDAQVQARLQRADLDNRQFDLGGSTVTLRNIQVDGAGDANWWGEVALRSGHIDAAAPYEVTAQADLRLRDAGPVLGVFAQRSDYPRWVLGLLDSGEVQATGQLRWRRDHLALDDLKAENDRLSLRARLDMAKAGKRGDLYVRWGVFGAGIELDGEQRSWHLKGAREWYDGRPRILPASPPQP
ncbi:hypothetical protein [Stenotrophomonas rhizophila]|uniref:hypothetical protein n=1 Tax=Stenotrophomonas rhizophila TaxID=216778 RepID=UPI0011A94668|nr:hypothetical protein [Stenotrophomonas rhizophila]